VVSTAEVEGQARRFAALGDSARLRIAEQLLLGDASPGELAAVTGAATNLMAHHLRVLDEAGLIRRVRSEGDRRRSYVQLRRDDPAVRALADLLTERVRPPAAPDRVVFVCTHNSARSQLAAAAWGRISQLPTTSAGTHPALAVHPLAVATAARHALALDPAAPRAVADTIDPSDLVVAVCDNAYEELVTSATAARVPGPRASRDVVAWLHWSVPDPVRVGTKAAFEATYIHITGRVRDLARALP
jgi:ArsR family transcriptional regulator, arsenate/arsenite/antimonite-responsive transcriptional repressor / arsenate reductase (thioredoxin)